MAKSNHRIVHAEIQNYLVIRASIVNEDVSKEPPERPPNDENISRAELIAKMRKGGDFYANELNGNGLVTTTREICLQEIDGETYIHPANHNVANPQSLKTDFGLDPYFYNHHRDRTDTE